VSDMGSCMFSEIRYFQDVIAKMQNHDGNDIEVLPDGTWTPIEPKKESDEPPTKVFVFIVELIVFLL